MALISCPECGKQISDRAASCPECGCPISVAPSVVAQPDVSKDVEKLLTFARRAREASDSLNAKKYYDQILDKDPGNWEAIFFSVYFEAIECRIRDIASAAYSVGNSVNSSFAAIGDLKNEDEIDAAIDTVITYALSSVTMFINASVSHYTKFSTTDGAFGECSSRVVAATYIYQEIETSLKKNFPNKKERIAQHQKGLVSFLIANKRWYNNDYLINLINTLGEEIKTVDSSYQTPTFTPSTGGCYVATAVYGSYDCPQVWTLRRYRDNILAETWSGRLFIKTYYAISPTLVKWFGETDWFKNLWRNKLDIMVQKLKENGVKDTPYDDKVW